MLSHTSMCYVYHMIPGTHQLLPECEDKKAENLPFTVVLSYGLKVQQKFPVFYVSCWLYYFGRLQNLLDRDPMCQK